MITKIELTNFKSHAHTVIEPGRVTALVGPNGSGKTSIMRALYLALFSARDTHTHLFSEENAPTHLVRQQSNTCSISLSGKENSNLWEWVLDISLPKETSEREIISNQWRWNERPVHDTRRGLTSPGLDDKRQIEAVIEEAHYFKAVGNDLSSPSYSEHIPPSMDSDGIGLASALAYVILTAPEEHLLIENSLKEIVPSIKRVRAKPALVKLTERKIFSVNGTQVPYDEERGVMGYELVFDTTSAKDLPAHAVSEGTLLALGLLTILYTSSASHLILLDDIEAALHPLAQRQLIQILKDFAEKNNRQIIVASHSPYIIDELSAEDVWVMATDKEGISHCNRLSNHPDKDRALEVLTTGEFLSAEGEDWVIDNPFPAETVNA